MTIFSVALGSFFALHTGGFRWFLFFLVLAGMVFVHAATNVINDYFDVKHGVDREDSPTARYRTHFLLTGALQPRQVLRFGIVLYAVAGCIAVYLTVVRGWVIPLFAAVGGLVSFFYTGGPVRYKHRGLGEPAVFLMWGPVMMGASYFVQTGGWTGIGTVLLVSIPQGLWVLLVLLANNIKDIRYDTEVGVNTIANLLSHKQVMLLFVVLVVGVYVVTGVEIAAGVLPVLTLISFASLPLAVPLIIRMGKDKEVPPDADPRTARVGMVYSGLLLSSLIIDYIVG
jgi:1,4-dihydroxy-2-naphthoate octaprenyltransferase